MVGRHKNIAPRMGYFICPNHLRKSVLGVLGKWDVRFEHARFIPLRFWIGVYPNDVPSSGFENPKIG
jgi:hypothetical protein